MASEEFYDTEIAPVLLELAKTCEANGLSFLAVAEWVPGEQGRTIQLEAGCGLGIRIAEMAARANGNVDALILGLMAHARQHGHSSVCLKQLGVPERPPEVAG